MNCSEFRTCGREKVSENGQQCIKRIWKVHLECLQAPCILQPNLYPLSCILTRKAKGKGHTNLRELRMSWSGQNHTKGQWMFWPVKVEPCHFIPGRIHPFHQQLNKQVSHGEHIMFYINWVNDVMASYSSLLTFSYFPLFFAGHKLQVLITSSGNCVAFSPFLSLSHFILFP